MERVERANGLLSVDFGRRDVTVRVEWVSLWKCRGGESSLARVVKVSGGVLSRGPSGADREG